MKDIDLFHTVAVIREIGLFGEWIPFLRHSDVVHELDFSRLLAHFSIGVAFTSATSQHAMVVVSVDLRTRLPRSILDFFLKKLVGIFLWLWRRQSRYISAHDEGKHRDAIAADAAFYENWLRPKYDEFCAARGWTDTSPALGADEAEDEVGDDAALPPGLDGAEDGGAAESPAPAVGGDADAVG
ncbi:hypothetical protein JL720_6339 [Aureococcus anophagefferens]|nr:hypothetical protein JL720_6339 [Aureococcus anophagefferens]